MNSSPPRALSPALLQRRKSMSARLSQPHHWSAMLASMSSLAPAVPWSTSLRGIDSPEPSNWIKTATCGLKRPPAASFSYADATVSSPAQGTGSVWQDWDIDDPKLGRHKWETFVTGEVSPVIENDVTHNGNRRLVGLSMSTSSAARIKTPVSLTVLPASPAAMHHRFHRPRHRKAHRTTSSTTRISCAVISLRKYDAWFSALVDKASFAASNEKSQTKSPSGSAARPIIHGYLCNGLIVTAPFTDRHLAMKTLSIRQVLLHAGCYQRPL